jgi:hypothetical protein
VTSTSKSEGTGPLLFSSLNIAASKGPGPFARHTRAHDQRRATSALNSAGSVLIVYTAHSRRKFIGTPLPCASRCVPLDLGRPGA